MHGLARRQQNPPRNTRRSTHPNLSISKTPSQSSHQPSAVSPLKGPRRNKEIEKKNLTVALRESLIYSLTISHPGLTDNALLDLDIYIYAIYTSNLGLGVADLGRESEHGRFRGSTEGANNYNRFKTLVSITKIKRGLHCLCRPSIMVASITTSVPPTRYPRGTLELARKSASAGSTSVNTEESRNDKWPKGLENLTVLHPHDQPHFRLPPSRRFQRLLPNPITRRESSLAKYTLASRPEPSLPSYALILFSDLAYVPFC